MSDAKKCDICGCFYLKTKHQSLQIRGHDPYDVPSWKALDICDVCFDKLIDFIDNIAQK